MYCEELSKWKNRKRKRQYFPCIWLNDSKGIIGIKNTSYVTWVPTYFFGLSLAVWEKECQNFSYSAALAVIFPFHGFDWRLLSWSAETWHLKSMGWWPDFSFELKGCACASGWPSCFSGDIFRTFCSCFFFVFSSKFIICTLWRNDRMQSCQ